MIFFCIIDTIEQTMMHLLIYVKYNNSLYILAKMDPRIARKNIGEFTRKIRFYVKTTVVCIDLIPLTLILCNMKFLYRYTETLNYHTLSHSHSLQEKLQNHGYYMYKFNER